MKIRDEKKLGFIQNLVISSQLIINQPAHILVGIYAGYPEYAVTLRVAIVFILSSLIEIPAGIFADRYGRVKTVFYSFILNAISLILLMLSASMTNFIEFSIFILLLSIILSSFASAMGSGAYEVVLQSYVDSKCADNDLRVKQLTISLRHWKLLPLISSTILLILFFYLEYSYRSSYLYFIIPVFIIIYNAYYFKNIGLEVESYIVNEPKNNKYKIKDYILEIADKKILSEWSLIIIYNFLMIYVHTYLIISLYREIGDDIYSIYSIAKIFILLVIFSLAHYVQSFIVPTVLKYINKNYSVILSFGILIIFSYLCSKYIHIFGVINMCIIYAVFFRAIISLGQGIINSEVMIKVNRDMGAGVMSFIALSVTLIFGAYSIFLTFDNGNVGTISNLLSNVILMSILGFLFSINFLIKSNDK